VIVSQIIGGLGNQMFQYAAGLALANKHGQPLLLDIRLFDNYDLRPEGFLLDKVFKIDANIAEAICIRNMFGWRTSRIGHRILREKYFSFLRGENYKVQNGMDFTNDFFELPSSCYLSGYWQSERYFKEYENLIREHFTFTAPMNKCNLDIVKQIQGISGAVSLHVRRGDYIWNNHTNSIHGVCSADYYQKAMSLIAKHVFDPVYFVFSDDLDWVKANLSIEYKHIFIDHNIGDDSFKDMQLMSFCQHHIIANSSFSWWGSWLNPSPDKIVIAPKKWFSNGLDISDITPMAWLKL
jgi:hypothetical protein